MKMNNKSNFREWLNRTTEEVGAHSACCISMDDPKLKEVIDLNNKKVENWLKSGYHGEMEYLERMFPEKSNPWKTFPKAKSVILVAFTNKWGDPQAIHPFPHPQNNNPIGYISSYAKEIDYHIKGMQILESLRNRFGQDIDAEFAVDTKPVYERLFAVFGGLGVIGANDLLRVPDRINVRVFIGAIFLNIDLPSVIYKPIMPFKCEDCLACIKNCPTGAIKQGEAINSLKCISYLTIEKKSILSREEGLMINDWIFGCDDCSTVCPPKEKVDTRIPIDLSWLIKTPTGIIRRLIKNNATSYAGVTQLRRNAVVVLKNNYNSQSYDLLKWIEQNNKSELIQKQLKAW